MTILIAGGDSFTWGSELSDCITTKQDHHYSLSTYSSLLAKQLDMSYSCVALPGNSNSGISRLVTRAVHNTKDKFDVCVIVMWTFPNRFEFRWNTNTGTRSHPWYSITPWTHETKVDRIKSHFKRDNKDILNHHENHAKTMASNGIADFSKNYYKIIGDSEVWEYYTTYKEIVFLQNYLKKHNVPYIFTFAEDIFNILSKDSDLDVLLSEIDMDNFYDFEGFYRWACDNGYPIGTTHPLELAHEDFCDMLLPLAKKIYL